MLFSEAIRLCSVYLDFLHCPQFFISDLQHHAEKKTLSLLTFFKAATQWRTVTEKKRGRGPIVATKWSAHIH